VLLPRPGAHHRASLLPSFLTSPHLTRPPGSTQAVCARALLEAGTQPDLRDSYGHNASYWAVQVACTAICDPWMEPPQ
jgi:hypothetical protein